MSRRVLYVVGTGYTGSTLLSFLMNAHPDVASVGEATGPYELVEDHRTYPCSCGKTLPDCEFWRDVSAQMEARGFAFGPNRWDLRFAVSTHRVGYQLLYQSLRSNTVDALRDRFLLAVPAWRRKLEETARRNEAFVESVLQVAGKQVFFDASKAAARARFLLRLTDLDVRILHLVRDSFGFVSSHMNRGRSLDSGVRYWNRTAGHARRLAALVPPDRFLRVRYENLCRDTDAELGRIARFAGLEPRPGPVNFRAPNHHMIGSHMRLETSGDVVLDERWRDRLSARDKRIIGWRTGRRRRELGYTSR